MNQTPVINAPTVNDHNINVLTILILILEAIIILINISCYVSNYLSNDEIITNNYPRMIALFLVSVLIEVELIYLQIYDLIIIFGCISGMTVGIFFHLNNLILCKKHSVPNIIKLTESLKYINIIVLIVNQTLEIFNNYYNFNDKLLLFITYFACYVFAAISGVIVTLDNDCIPCKRRGYQEIS
jgi:hypothetical protein